MRRAWKVFLTDGSFIVVRLYKKSVSFRQCLEILDWRGYTYSDIQSMDEEWEED